MGEVINLRRARKQIERKAKQADAANNRAVHGRSKTDKKRGEAEAAKSAKDLDAHRRDPKSE